MPSDPRLLNSKGGRSAAEAWLELGRLHSGDQLREQLARYLVTVTPDQFERDMVAALKRGGGLDHSFAIDQEFRLEAGSPAFLAAARMRLEDECFRIGECPAD